MRPLAFVLLALPGCDLDKDEDKNYRRTPDGYLVWTVGAWHGQDLAVVYDNFDYAVKRAALELERDNGVPYASTINWAHQIKYQLHDHLFFTYKGRFFHGLYWPRHEPEIWAAYWNYSSSMDPADIPADAPEWTVYQGTDTGTWYWGVYDPALMVPVVKHELGWGLGVN